MSDTRTFQTTDEAEYVTHSEIVSSIAGPCANKLMRMTIPNYIGRRSQISLTLDLNDIGKDGSFLRYQSDPIVVTGWQLETYPFFLSDPMLDLQGAVFVKHYDGKADLINEDFYEKYLSDLPAQAVFPLERLLDVSAELTKILTYRS